MAPDLHAPTLWLGTSPLLDLEDPRLRLKVRSLTQLCAGAREQALSLYGFVKRMPFAKPFKMRLYTAREVMDHGRGDAADKATLLVAMLRLAGLPARMQFVTLRTEVLRGLLPSGLPPLRPLVQVFLDGAWQVTDTYIYDASYAAAAHKRLREQGWECGYGLHVHGRTLWDGRGSAYVDGAPPTEDWLVLQDHGAFCDPLEFMSSPAYRSQHARLARALQWNLQGRVMDRAIRALRQGEATG